MCEEEIKSICGCPCNPDSPCDECAPYWQRMIEEGVWDEEKHQWTEKKWNDICRLLRICPWNLKWNYVL